jgi:uncharacterized protein (DUF362 family)/Pyruvate/2-oxoacid:ferredoxin oxidoreductase delta subunit
VRSTVSSIKIDSYNIENFQPAVEKLLDPIGGMKRFIKPGMNVLINPNLLSARTPDRGVTTDPALVATVANMCIKIGANVRIGDSPGGIVKGLKRTWDNTGMTAAAESTGAELIGFELGDIDKLEIENREHFISRYAAEADFIISLPKLKTHVLTNFTGAIKNCYGFVPGLRKSDYHKKNPGVKEFSNVVVDIFSLVKPGLFIMDGGLAMEGEGPASGDTKWLGYLFASTDGVAIDSSVMSILHPGRRKVWTTDLAAKRGLGVAKLSQIDRLGPAFKSGAVDDFKMPSNFYMNLIPSLLVKTLEPYLWVRPTINNEICEMCDICRKNCPQETIFEKDGKMIIEHENCIKCMCCHELCPHKSVYLKKSRLAKIIR